MLGLDLFTGRPAGFEAGHEDGLACVLGVPFEHTGCRISPRYARGNPGSGVTTEAGRAIVRPSNAAGKPPGKAAAGGITRPTKVSATGRGAGVTTRWNRRRRSTAWCCSP